MSNKARSLRTAVGDFMATRRIPGEMEQNLLKEAIHLHLLSALSDAGVLRHVVFQGGTALRLCYGGERYSEGLDFVCGRSGAYLLDIEFQELVERALETTRRTLQRDFDIAPGGIALKRPAHPMAIMGEAVGVAAWQIVVPIDAGTRPTKSRIKIEFANVPSYESGPRVARASPGLVQVQDVILAVESPNEILADKAVALTARAVLKYRDIWDVWDLVDRLQARADAAIVRQKFADYGTVDVGRRARRRLDELASPQTAASFLGEMKRFLPATRVADMTSAKLHHAILLESAKLIERVVLDASPRSGD